MEEQKIRELLIKNEVLKTGHFALSPKEVAPNLGILEDFHSNTYVKKDEMLGKIHLLNLLAGEMIYRYKDALRIDQPVCDFVVGCGSVAGPLAAFFGLHLFQMNHKNVRVVAAVKQDGQIILSNCYRQRYPKSRFVVIEDTVVSGTAVRKLLKALLEVGAVTQYVCTVAKWAKADIGDVPLESLIELSDAEQWPAKICKLCLDPMFGPSSVDCDVNTYGAEFLKKIRTR